IVHFAHVEWFLSYDSDFQIVGGKPTARGKRGLLRFQPLQRSAHPSVPAKPSPPICQRSVRQGVKGLLPARKHIQVRRTFLSTECPQKFCFRPQSESLIAFGYRHPP